VDGDLPTPVPRLQDYTATLVSLLGDGVSLLFPVWPLTTLLIPVTAGATALDGGFLIHHFALRLLSLALPRPRGF
jgi:hypothetical protein